MIEFDKSKIKNSIFDSLWRCGLLVILCVLTGVSPAHADSTRKERILIKDGNALYRSQKFAEAKVKYRDALNENGSSAVAQFNLALCNVNLARINKDNDSISKKLLSDASAAFMKVAELGKENPSLASKSNYNMGNLQFESENYQAAIQLYKQALRLDPDFENARRNLRIAQLKLQNQQQDKKDQNMDKDQEQQKDQEQNKDKQDQDQQDQDQQNQDKQNQDQQNKDQQNQQPQPNELSDQAAQQILNAVENNEQKARQSSNKGPKAAGRSGRLKKW